MELFLNTEVAEQCSYVTLCIPAVHFCKKAFEFPRLYAILFAEVLFGVNSILGLHYVIKGRITPYYGFQCCYFVKLISVLLQHAHAHAFGNIYPAGSGVDVA